MKNFSLLTLLMCFLFACSDDKTDMPQIELGSLLLNGEEKDYSSNLQELPPLSMNDYADVSFRLYGNGADLISFVVQSEGTHVVATISDYPEDKISLELSSVDRMLRYKDDVKSSWVTVRVRVRWTNQEKAERPAVYLSSKAHVDEGAVYYLDDLIATTTSPHLSE